MKSYKKHFSDLLRGLDAKPFAEYVVEKVEVYR